jgi:hypothetical protein
MSRSQWFVCCGLAVGIGLLACFVCQLPCIGLPGLGRTHDYVVLIETEPEPAMFEFPGCRIGPVVKASISYYQPDRPDLARIEYEKLYYHDWQPIGCRRLKDLEFPHGGNVGIEVRHKRGFATKAELGASADAILRMFIDLFAERTAASAIIVPDDSMDGICEEMNRWKFYAGDQAKPEVPIICPIILPIENSSGNTKKVLYYMQ